MRLFSQRLKELRLERNLSQSKVAEAANVSQRAISAYEKGQIEATEGVIIALCKYFNVSADYLLGLSDDF